MVNHFNDLYYIEMSIKQKFSILLFPKLMVNLYFETREHPGEILPRIPILAPCFLFRRTPWRPEKYKYLPLL